MDEHAVDEQAQPQRPGSRGGKSICLKYPLAPPLVLVTRRWEPQCGDLRSESSESSDEDSFVEEQPAAPSLARAGYYRIVEGAVSKFRMNPNPFVVQVRSIIDDWLSRMESMVRENESAKAAMAHTRSSCTRRRSA